MGMCPRPVWARVPCRLHAVSRDDQEVLLCASQQPEVIGRAWDCGPQGPWLLAGAVHPKAIVLHSPRLAPPWLLTPRASHFLRMFLFIG